MHNIANRLLSDVRHDVKRRVSLARRKGDQCFIYLIQLQLSHLLISCLEETRPESRVPKSLSKKTSLQHQDSQVRVGRHPDEVQQPSQLFPPITRNYRPGRKRDLGRRDTFHITASKSTSCGGRCGDIDLGFIIFHVVGSYEK